jgi:NADPH:quinone reductase-like Zn-dependent oxidoreductase
MALQGPGKNRTNIHPFVSGHCLTAVQSVLIHGGTRGVDLAAIQVACMLGTEIHTIVGSEKKA